MLPTLLASFWSDLSVFHEKMRITKKSKNIFFSKKKMYLFFFLNFLFFDIFSHFSGGKKKTKIFVFFSYKKNLRNVFELKFWHEKLINFNENFFGAFNRLLLRLKIFLLFWDSCRCFEPIWKKKTENLKTISKNLQFLKFHLWVCGRNFGQSAENSVKNILLPKILTKRILSKIRPLHHQNIQKVDPPPKNGHFWGGRTLFVTYPSKVLNCLFSYVFCFVLFFEEFTPLLVQLAMNIDVILDTRDGYFFSLC